MRCADALPDLAKYYEQHIEQWPLIRTQYELLEQLTLPIEMLAYAPQPSEYAAIYMPADEGHSPLPAKQESSTICPSCQHPLVELLEVPSEILSKKSERQITIYYCEHCLIAETTYFYRNKDGKCEMKYPIIAEIQNENNMSKVRSASIRWIRLNHPKETNCCCSFIGGSPNWVQKPVYPKCFICKKKMLFILQLGSDLTGTSGVDFGYGATLYLHYCYDCHVSAQTHQVD
jgi:hypothetical protein